MLQQQLHARAIAPMIVRAAAVTEKTAEADKVRAQQVEIHKAAVDLVKSIGGADAAERLAVKRAMNKLAFGDMLDAVQRCEGLQRLAAAEAFAQPVAELTGVQDRIVASLRKLLDATRLAEAEAAAGLKSRRSSESPTTPATSSKRRRKAGGVPPPTEEAHRGEENLAKKPVEDFTARGEGIDEGDGGRGGRLVAVHEGVALRHEQAPRAGLRQPVVAKELVEIQTELKMAEDALPKKTVEIAVPLEQLGYERAEELTTNMEKWLTDTPKREKWSQEESLSDKDKEAPMAELPGELEDIVGQLMEQEEDLFDEMEDVSSSAADSLDKGAGWDAVDGPISNMSARASPGTACRTRARSAAAAARGGRASPAANSSATRPSARAAAKLPAASNKTPSPRDKSRTTARTRSAAPPAAARKTARAARGSKAQCPDRRATATWRGSPPSRPTSATRPSPSTFSSRSTKFHHTDLKKMVDTMSQVERDLKAGLPKNALRQRRVLADGLGNVKQCLNGEFQVRQDSTSNLPTDVQKQILGSMQIRRRKAGTR